MKYLLVSTIIMAWFFGGAIAMAVLSEIFLSYEEVFVKVWGGVTVIFILL